MAYYNEAKAEYLLADKLLSSFGQTVNAVSLSILTHRSENNVRQFLWKYSPHYFVPYIDTKKTHGCHYKYRASTPRANRIREELSERLLTGSHLNLRKHPFSTPWTDYTDFKILTGIDNYFIRTLVDLRDMIRYVGKKTQPIYDKYHGDTEFYKFLLDEGGTDRESKADLIIFNHNWYPPENKKHILTGINENLDNGVYGSVKLRGRAMAIVKGLEIELDGD